MIIFLKSVVCSWNCVSSKNICGDFVFHWSNYTQNIENNLNKNLNFCKIFKIILINENSCLQMYPNEISFLAYWLLRIKWLFAKSGKTTKNRVIHKNRLFPSFYCLVIAELKRKVNFAMICWEQYLIKIFYKL